MPAKQSQTQLLDGLNSYSLTLGLGTRLCVCLMVIACLCFSGALFAAEKTQPLLWKVENITSQNQPDDHSQGVLYLLGSIHFGNPDLYPLPNYVNQAFKNSDRLAVELDPLALDPAEVAWVMANRGRLPAGQKLHQVIAPEQWQQLQQVLQDAELPLDAMQRLKPWLVAVQLTAAQVRRSGFSEGYGVDRHFLTLARHPEAPKPIVSLESFDAQMKAFDSLPREDQLRLLEHSINDSYQAESTLLSIISAWRNGDAVTLDGLINQAFDQSDQSASALYQRVFTDRDARMEQRLLEYLQNGEKLFVVVGAGHVVGDEGLAQRFAKRGFKVTQVQ